jgi:hypothetical protein
VQKMMVTSQPETETLKQTLPKLFIFLKYHEIHVLAV